MKMDHKLVIDLNLAQQLKEVRTLWNQDTAYARKKRKEFIDNAMRVGGLALVVFLLGYVKGIKTGAGYGNIIMTLNSKGE